MLKYLSKFFPSKHEKDIKEILPLLDKIDTFYQQYKNLSDEELKAKTIEFKERIKSETKEIDDRILELHNKLKEDLDHNERVEVYDELDELEKLYFEKLASVIDSLLPEAFAVVKDTCRRLCGTEWEAAGSKIKWNMIHSMFN